MIPGVLVALVLARSIRISDTICGRVAAFGAVGIGFGGQETYGQTVGFVTAAGENFWLGLTGLGVKGAVWGLLGGAVLGTVLVARRASRLKLFVGFGLLVVGTWLGWRLINQPRLIYFSNLYDRPRAEVWAGLLMGGAVFLGWLVGAMRPHFRVPLTFALLGTIGGGIGFAGGGVLYAGGSALGWHGSWFPGWKLLEFTFGFCFGAALGVAAWLQRNAIADVAPDSPAHGPSPHAAWRLAALIALSGALIVSGFTLSVRFGFTVAGVGLLVLAFESEWAAWQIAITGTAGAFLLDVGRFFNENHRSFPPAAATAAALILTAVLGCWVAARVSSSRDMVSSACPVLLWTAVGAAVLKSAWHPVISTELIIVTSVFFLGGGLITVLFLTDRHEAPRRRTDAPL
jgi:hypothetical protein